MIALKTTLLLKIIHGGGGNSLINNGLDTYTHYIDDYSFLDVTEITNTPQDNEYLSSLDLSEDTNLREYLPNGTKYIIQIYKKIGINYDFHKQQKFTVGDINPKIELDAGTYSFRISSLGSSIEPVFLNNYKNYWGCSTSFIDLLITDKLLCQEIRDMEILTIL